MGTAELRFLESKPSAAPHVQVVRAGRCPTGAHEVRTPHLRDRRAGQQGGVRRPLCYVSLVRVPELSADALCGCGEAVSSR